MTQKLATRELERLLRKEPENLALRLRLAASYREIGRSSDAVQLYRSVAVAYHAQRRLAQAIAVCRSVLEIEPGQRETLALLAELEAMRPGSEGEGSPADAGWANPPTGTMPAVQPPPASTLPPWSAGAGTGTGPALTPPPDPSSGGMPAVRVLDRDIAVRELAPVRALRTPSGSMPIAAAPPPRIGQGVRRTDQVAVAPPPVPPPSTGVPKRASAPEDTPLPKPMPYHDVGDDSMAYMMPMPPSALTPPPAPPSAGPPVGRTPPRAGGGPQAMPVIPAVRASAPPSRLPLTGEDSEDAATGVTGDRPLGRRRVPLPPRPLTPPPDDEDAVTHVSGEWPAQRPPAGGPNLPRTPTRPMPAQASPTSSMDIAAEVETRRLPRLSPRELELLRKGTGTEPPPRADLDEEPTRPPLAGLPPPRQPPTPPSRLPSDLPADLLAEIGADASDGTPDLPHETAPEVRPRIRPDVSPPVGYMRGSRPSDAEGGWGEEATDQRGPDLAMPEAIDDAALPMPVFDRPFAETLQGLGPDGSAIEDAGGGRLGVFSSLPADAVAELERQMFVREVTPGDIVLREGDRGDSCFVIGAGEVRVLKSSGDEGGPPVEVARLGEGAMFGEFALLADRRRHATVEAVTTGELYEIPRRLLRELAAGHPEVGPALERFYRERLLSTLLTTATLFKSLPEDRRADLLARFSPVHAQSGQALVREGENAGGFYLIVLGAVDIVKRVNERRQVLLATLREGAYFGEMSLLSGHTASASVIAAGPVELAKLPPRDFYDVVATHPRLWETMRSEARHRELDNARIVAGDSSAV